MRSLSTWKKSDGVSHRCGSMAMNVKAGRLMQPLTVKKMSEDVCWHVKMRRKYFTYYQFIVMIQTNTFRSRVLSVNHVFRMEGGLCVSFKSKTP